MLDNLSKIRKIISEIDSINRGGCGIAAYAVYLYLKEKDILPKSFRIVTLHCTDMDNAAHNNRFIIGQEKNGVSANHIGFMIDNIIMDCKKIIDLTEYRSVVVIPRNKIVEYLISALTTSLDWNPSFNRNRQIPIIEKKLKIKLEL